ncbi:19652_t:CDS:2 [Gigaspora margarita]|uniref:19652_t:CDS:1 n=1 Tax=Gigaspora margarita TaxID=4874 RepID=A0ABN7UJ88_GIGMA|nr:19652_t:CDS:2 [Gigaspora margarita]
MAISATNISSQTPSSSRHSRVPTMTIALSTSAQQKLNLLSQREAEVDSNFVTNKNFTFTEEDSPKYPTSAHIPPVLTSSVDPPTPLTRKWGRHCACNSVVVIIVFAYLVTAYIRTNGRWT